MKPLLFISIVLILVSCKKEPIQYTFEGTLTENISNNPLSGVTVKIYQKPFNNSISSNSFNLVGSAVTDASGHYEIMFEREKVTEFKVTFRKEGYFGQDIILGSADVSSENSNQVDGTMEARSWVKIDLQNVAPANTSDEFTLIFYIYRQGCENCIESDYNYFNGIIDTTLIYENTSDQYLKFTEINVSGGQSNTDSLYMVPFDTVSYSITY